MDYFRKKFYGSVKPKLHHVPSELSEMKVNCGSCSFTFIPDWLSKRPPLVPIKPLNYEGPGRFIPFSAILKCPNCSAEVALALPSKKAISTYDWYGDEAYRNTDGKAIITYTLVGNNRHLVAGNISKIRDLKQSIFPNVSHDAWKIHMAKIWNASDRGGHDLFKHLTQPQVIAFSKQVAKLIKSLSEGFLVYTVTGIYSKPADKLEERQVWRDARDMYYSSLLIKVIDDSTRCGVRPVMHFDSDSKDGWAKEAFYGSQVSLLYAYLAKGIEIPEPVYLPPGSHEFNELADFVGFFVARYCHRKIMKKNVEIDPSRMGKIMYIGFSPQGDMLFSQRSGFPWKLFYGYA